MTVRTQLNFVVTPEDKELLKRLQETTGCSKTYLLLAGLRLVEQSVQATTPATFITKGA